MNNKSFRIRTEVGSNQNIKININQSFETLEILSLKLFQKELYTSDTSDYGVVVGRVQSKGVGIPNCKISLFIPLQEIDKDNPFITQIYPFTDVLDIGKDNKRYNLLPKIKENNIYNNYTLPNNDGYGENYFGLGYTPDTPLGSFFIKDELCVNDAYIEVFEKYYKYTTKTNESGDYCIFGVPLGIQILHLDCDLTDIGRWSLKPVVLSKLLNYPASIFDNEGTKIKKLKSLEDAPHIQSQNKSINVIPFIGLSQVNGETREIGITRQDFDINVNILPTTTIFGNAITMPQNSYWYDFVNFRAKVGSYRFWLLPLPIPFLHFDFTSNENVINGGKYDINPFHFEVDSLDIIDSSGDTGFSVIDFNADPSAFNGGIFGDNDDFGNPLKTDKLLLNNHRNGEIKVNIFDHQYDEPILLSKNQYIFEQNFGSYYIIIPCNVDKVITNEFGDLISTTDPNLGFGTKFKGSIHYYMDGEMISDSSKVLVDRIWMKIPQEINYDTDPTSWISKYFPFEQNKIYSTVQRWWSNTGTTIYDMAGSIENIDYDSNDMIDYNGVSILQDKNVHFSLYFLQYGNRQKRKDRKDPPNDRRAFCEGISTTRDSNLNDIGGGLFNTRHLSRGDNFKTNFFHVPKVDIIQFLKEQKKSNYNISNLVGNYYNPTSDIYSAPIYQQTNFIFYKGLKNSDCFKFLYNNNIF